MTTSSHTAVVTQRLERHSALSSTAVTMAGALPGLGWSRAADVWGGVPGPSGLPSGWSLARSCVPMLSLVMDCAVLHVKVACVGSDGRLLLTVCHARLPPFEISYSTRASGLSGGEDGQDLSERPAFLLDNVVNRVVCWVKPDISKDKGECEEKYLVG